MMKILNFKIISVCYISSRNVKLNWQITLCTFIYEYSHHDQLILTYIICLTFSKKSDDFDLNSIFEQLFSNYFYPKCTLPKTIVKQKIKVGPLETS